MSGAVFIDLDETALRVSSERTFVAHLRASGRVSNARFLLLVATFAAHGLGLIGDYHRTKRKVCRILLRGESCDEVAELARTFAREHLASQIHGEVVDVVRRAHEAGMRVHLLSASLDFLVEPCARLLGVDGWSATVPQRRDGRFTGGIDGPVRFGIEKARAMEEIAAREGIDPAASAAYSDSVLDRPLLEAVGRPHAVNPDRALRELAGRRGWPVLRWSVASR